MMTDNDTITKAELTEALKSVSIYTGPLDGRKRELASYPRALANDLFRKAEADRTPPEPAYTDGGVYTDAQGEYWRFYDPDPTRGWSVKVWNAFGDAREYAFDVPRRPMTAVPKAAGDPEFLTASIFNPPASYSIDLGFDINDLKEG